MNSRVVGLGCVAIGLTIAGCTATRHAERAPAPAAARLWFRVPPQRATAGIPIAPSVEVVIVDATGRLVTGARHRVSVSANATGALSGITSVEAKDGVAVFSDLRVDAAGSFVLVAQADGLDSVAGPIVIAPVAAPRFRPEPSIPIRRLIAPRTQYAP